MTVVFIVALCLPLLLVPRLEAQTPDSDFIEPYNSEQEPGDPISPQEALQSLRLPDGFRATVFAAEPDIRNPIAACTDAAGRVWVAENFTYAERSQRFDLNLSDRIVVLEDVDGNGIADRQHVFADNLKVLTGITVGRGGVWAMCPPQLLFIPDEDGDLIPDGPPQVKLDGFHNARENYHNFANGLSWGPDNWLYGRCGASCPGEMGLPGSAEDARVPIRGTMWRYHPERKSFEALAQGTTNPWGHDWNEVGDLFFINTVNGHFWQCIPGAHYVRPHTLDVNPYSYELIDMHADHWHFDTGKSWTASRDGAANDYGGGHAHIGMMVYQEDKWPQEYRGAVMTINMHGRRVNVEELSRHGSGYLASHGDDFLLSDDLWFRGMELLPLPDGNVLLIDWSDTGECHEQTGVHRQSGRIFKIIYEEGSQGENPLRDAAARQDPGLLATLQTTGSEWVARRARELLSVHHLRQTDLSQAVQQLQSVLDDSEAPIEHRLRALWSLVCIDGVERRQLVDLLDAKQEALRSWAVRLLVENWRLDTAYGKRPADTGEEVDPDLLDRLVRMAGDESAPSVRLDLASALQRLPLADRADLAISLVGHVQDADDHNLPLMVWYGLAPLGDDHIDDLLAVLQACEWPQTRRLIARRVADRSKQHPEKFQALFLTTADRDEAFRRDVVLGTFQAFAGWRKAVPPENWEAWTEDLKLEEDAELQTALQNLSVLFGDGRTVDELKRTVQDDGATLETRMSALKSLVDAKADGISQLCRKVLSVRFLNAVAAEGLASEADPSIGRDLVDAYGRFHPSDRPGAISVLTSRPAWAKELLAAVAKGKIDRSEISAFQARQLASLENDEINELLAKHWGQVRVSSEAKRETIVSLKSQLTPGELAEANRKEGREIFQKSCSSCHKLFGSGGQLGPDLTGAQRSNLDYLLENIVDPSAVVTKEFRASIILLDDDRVLSGLVTEQTENVVTLATQNEQFKLATENIVELRQTNQSTMPEGLLDQLTSAQIRNLIAYLQSTEQVPLD
ncbi:MAG: c-type cytochrome [bacterium]|nr:c-type cytochrome [bacterium]